MATERFSIDYPVQGELLVAYAPDADGEVLRVADLYTSVVFRELWKLHQARDPSKASWPAFLRDWNHNQGAWAHGDPWQAYEAAEIRAALAALVGALPELDVSRVSAVDGGPPGSLAEAVDALVAFVAAAPDGTIYLCDD